jgi:hypothetical protein
MSINPKLFVISALERDPSKPGSDLKTVYLAIDNSSGGYPYWSESLYGVKYFTERPNIDEFLKGCSYIYRNVGMIRVYKVMLEEA